MTGLTLEYWLKLKKQFEPPRGQITMSSQIYLIGRVGDVTRLEQAMREASPPISPDLPFPYGPTISHGYWNDAPPDLVFMVVDGKLYAKIDLTNPTEFFARWKRDGEVLAELIKRLETQNR